ncbi:ADP-ribosyltransferase (plasmid) [Sphingobium limneticum]|mgnify:CR=1 FL=1|uniref:ADP ribosyltransferase domain-containing protein n=2 Tax=Sphingomonadaceae TaxID=41297 RepID=A0A7X4K8L6_9SPHN|nr:MULTISPECIES: ADP-ribosyltransferase [Alphaproteobacteria]MCC4253870.1 ADP-ribosyltransferase [Sphingobium naphthae]MDE0877156.1 hypothetical protein [Sphingomonas bacterium]MYL99187.1 hypothetical protein [Novosphingobium silvae]ATP22064.1 hypothetical protein BV87_26855 [Sphingobium yanoikuyae]AYO75558.1 hypothetical protein EBF16_00705 [Sphingobium yanoikuyae]
MTALIVTANGLIGRERELTEAEHLALRSYGADSTFFHAIAQGRTEALSHNPNFGTFSSGARAKRDAIDAVFSMSRLLSAQTLWSGHGHGWGVRGALEGAPASFVGLHYRYPGYISTSTERSWCDAFLDKRSRNQSRPTMLEFRLPAGSPAIDMHDGAAQGEFEILLPRDTLFSITDAQMLPGDLLQLILEPCEAPV